ncbi:MAG: glycerate kinase, partial [Clostridia bacterium]|nr:glycerate kinase [Clostridia bacterium]
VIMGVLRRARRVGVPVFIFGGTVIDPTELYRQGASSVLSICTGPQSLEEAMEYAEADLYDCVFAALRIYYDGHYSMFRNALRRQYADKLGGMFDDIAEKAGL